ncbi:hypothetical protein QEZ40_000828 [Streptomyces katrae]|uniref:Secreted protein n=1 Tax=Streptomyces katrae TaxID=68223 RepID=A0ABT7H658_9ACTN|nr:hypothetical protein [Streptomyces katrae]MDK9501387.1 hypothetical protein [Streptomyces katrae]
MKLTRTLATLCTAATAAVVLSAGTATADDDLLSALNNPAIGAACLPFGQAGVGNTVNGTQNIGCNQSTSQDITNPAPAGGGVTGEEVTFDVHTVPATTEATYTAQCPAGKVVTGGGYVRPASVDILASGSDIGPNRTAWGVVANNPTQTPENIAVYAVCVDAAT